MQKLTDQERENIAADVAPVIDEFHKIMRKRNALVVSERFQDTHNTVKSLLDHLFDGEDVTYTGTARIEVQKDFDGERLVGIRIGYHIATVYAGRGTDLYNG